MQTSARPPSWISITWPFDSRYAIFYRWSFETKPLSRARFAVGVAGVQLRLEKLRLRLENISKNVAGVAFWPPQLTTAIREMRPDDIFNFTLLFVYSCKLTCNNIRAITVYGEMYSSIVGRREERRRGESLNCLFATIVFNTRVNVYFQGNRKCSFLPGCACLYLYWLTHITCFENKWWWWWWWTYTHFIVMWCRPNSILSCNFMSCNFDGPSFSCLAFSVNPSPPVLTIPTFVTGYAVCVVNSRRWSVTVHQDLVSDHDLIRQV